MPVFFFLFFLAVVVVIVLVLFLFFLFLFLLGKVGIGLIGFFMGDRGMGVETLIRKNTVVSGGSWLL